jgi:hypothetical protein
MSILRITGTDPGFLKVHHTRYLSEVLHMRLRDAKHLTDDVIEGRVRELPVPAELAEAAAATLRILGARVEVGPAGHVAA